MGRDFNGVHFDFDDNCNYSAGSMKENELLGNFVKNWDKKIDKVIDGIEVAID